MAPIPSLLLTAAVHEHLVREKTRTRVGLVVETGDAREVHHIALLIGYGASAVNPYLAFETIDDMIARGDLSTGVTPRQARRNYIKAACKGVIKIMSKMGISTVASYTGAQIFEAVGLAREVVDEYFTGTSAASGERASTSWPKRWPPVTGSPISSVPAERAHRELEVGGEYQWRREGEVHLFNPKTVFKLQHATRAKRYDIFKEYTRLVDDQSTNLATSAGLLGSADGRRCSRRSPSTRSSRSSDDREALRHRGHVLRVHLGRGARDPRHRHEPPGRQVQHRRGGRGRRALRPRRQRRPPAQRHQAGGLGPLRRDERVPGERRRPPDQDRPGGQTRRGRAAAGPQGVPVDRQDPVLDARRRAHLARRRTTTSTPSRTSPSSSTT